MQGRVDEVYSPKHMQMSYIEFLEAIARIADMAWLPPPTEDFKMKFQTILEKKKTSKAYYYIHYLGITW